MNRRALIVLLAALAIAVPAPSQTAPSQSVPASIASARSLLNEGKLDQSAAILRTYLASTPTSADAHFLLGYVLFKDHKGTESLAEFTAGARYRRPTADEFKVVASDYVLLNDFTDADKWFTEAATEKPNDAELWYLLGRTKFNENIYPDAISTLERALAIRPRYIEAENNIGLCWKELNNPEKARTAFETAIQWQSDKPVDAQPYLNLGTLLADANQNEKALSYLTQAATLSPDNPTIHEELGKVYLSLQKLPEAQAHLEKAVSIAPEASALHFKLAQIYRKEGMTDRAQQEFDLCQKLNSTHSTSKIPNPPSLKVSDPR